MLSFSLFLTLIGVPSNLANANLSASSSGGRVGSYPTSLDAAAGGMSNHLIDFNSPPIQTPFRVPQLIHPIHRSLLGK